MQEKKVIADIKKMAKQGQMVSIFMFDLVKYHHFHEEIFTFNWDLSYW